MQVDFKTGTKEELQQRQYRGTRIRYNTKERNSKNSVKIRFQPAGRAQLLSQQNCPTRSVGGLPRRVVQGCP